jgi:outer membrane protein OmpA-like peptidoglycan-associated protein
MRTRTAAAASIALALAASAPRAAAQEAELDVERLKPAVTHDGFVVTEGSAVRDVEDPWEFSLLLNYGYSPLVVVDGDGDVTRRFVSGRLGADVMASVTLADPFAVGLDLPFFLAQTGDPSPSFAGLGDLRIVPKLRLFDDRETLGVALLMEVRVPTHLGDFSGGSRGVGFWPRVAVDHRFSGGLRLGTNLGVSVREPTTFANVKGGSELTYAVALGYRFGGNDGDVELGGELNGAVGIEAADIEEVPLEGLAYLKIDPAEEWQIVFGPGVGVIPGYGVPTFRAFAGIRYAPTSHDRDHDGIGDERDECPDAAEDRDRDRDTDGCPEEDADGDRDGVPDADDDCPTVKETINGEADDDGCPDTGDPRVIYEDGTVRVMDNVRFQSGSAQIDPASYSLLDQVALTLKANPEIKRVRVEGHTDETGTRELNVRLSKSRAQSVRAYLIRKGVSANRLSAEGYGPDRPLKSGDDEASRAKNRRVEFVIEE